MNYRAPRCPVVHEEGISSGLGPSIRSGGESDKGLKIYGQTHIGTDEYSRSCAPVLPDPEDGIEPSVYEQQVTESSSIGWGFDVPGNASVPGAFMTTRFGVELYF